MTTPDSNPHFRLRTTQAHIHKAHVDIVKLKWSRIAVAGQPHKHSFVRNGDEKRTVSVTVDDSLGKDRLKATLTSGVKDLLVLKSSGSSFEDFWVDEYTTLARELPLYSSYL